MSLRPPQTSTSPAPLLLSGQPIKQLLAKLCSHWGIAHMVATGQGSILVRIWLFQVVAQLSSVYSSDLFLFHKLLHTPLVPKFRSQVVHLGQTKAANQFHKFGAGQS